MAENELSIVGRSLPTKGAYEKVTGTAKFTADIELPRMLHAKILRSPHAHARILRIDTSKANDLPGVKALLTYKDAKIVLGDEVVLDNRVRYVGDKVAAVAATNEEIAAEALDLIEVQYEVLPAVLDLEEALKPEAPILHPDAPLVKGMGNLIEPVFTNSVGNVEKGFKDADYVFENRYTTQRQAHCALEPDVGVASWSPDGKLTYWTSSQGAFYVRRLLARGLNLPENMIRVILPHVGGAFGGKEYDRLENVICALLAKKAHRPVKLECNREEEFSTTRARSRCIFETKTGVKRDGSFTARYMKAIVDMGAYAYGLTLARRAGAWLLTPYSCPNYKYEGYAVYTNTMSSGPYRGFTSVPPHFALESDINEIAEKLGLDPIEIRMKNRRRTGEINPYNNVSLDMNGFDECMLKGADRIGWNKARIRHGKTIDSGKAKRRGVGMATLVHYAPALEPGSVVPGNATIRINGDGTVQLLIGIADMGQGINTTCAQIAAEELGVRFEDVSVTNADTDTTPWSTYAAGSTALLKTGGAVRAAAKKAKLKLFREASKILGGPVERLTAKDRRIFAKEKPSFGLAIKDVISAREESNPHASTESKAMYIESEATYKVSKYAPPWGAQFVEVEVDTETGMVKILKLVAAHDVGKAINPSIVEGQIQGSLGSSIGYALTEQLVLDKRTGAVLNPNFRDYKILSAPDMPKTEVILVETISSAGVFGAKGIGEPAHIPTAPAIADAIYNAVGVRIRDLPITPNKILVAMKEKSS